MIRSARWGVYPSASDCVYIDIKITIFQNILFLSFYFFHSLAYFLWFPGCIGNFYLETKLLTLINIEYEKPFMLFCEGMEWGFRQINSCANTSLGSLVMHLMSSNTFRNESQKWPITLSFLLLRVQYKCTPSGSSYNSIKIIALIFCVSYQSITIFVCMTYILF